MESQQLLTEAEGAAPPVDKRKKLFRLLGLVVLVAALAWGGFYWFFQRGLVNTDNAYVAAESAVTVDEPDMIATSFPGFVEMMQGLGGDVG